MSTIIVFETSSRQRELKRTLYLLGYKDRVVIQQCNLLYLPNFTLYHETNTPETCKNDVVAICKRLGIDLQRCIAAVFDGGSVICGEECE